MKGGHTMAYGCYDRSLTTEEHLIIRLNELARRQQVLLGEIASHKRWTNLMLAFLFPPYRQEKMRLIQYARRDLARIRMEMAELQEQQAAQLFVSGWRDALAQVADEHFLPTTPHH